MLTYDSLTICKRTVAFGLSRMGYVDQRSIYFSVTALYQSHIFVLGNSIIVQNFLVFEIINAAPQGLSACTGNQTHRFTSFPLPFYHSASPDTRNFPCSILLQSLLKHYTFSFSESTEGWRGEVWRGEPFCCGVLQKKSALPPWM